MSINNTFSVNGLSVMWYSRLICHLSIVWGMTACFRSFPSCFVLHQMSGGALFSHLPHLLSIPMKWWNIFRQRLPLIRLTQMGHRRRICLKQKRTLTVRRKKKSTPWILPHPPSASSPLGPSGAATDACSKCASIVREALLLSSMSLVNDSFDLIWFLTLTHFL